MIDRGNECSSYFFNRLGFHVAASHAASRRASARKPFLSPGSLLYAHSFFIPVVTVLRGPSYTYSHNRKVTPNGQLSTDNVPWLTSTKTSRRRDRCLNSVIEYRPRFNDTVINKAPPWPTHGGADGTDR